MFDTLNNDYDALAALHNGREIDAIKRHELGQECDLLEIAAFECMRSLVIEVGVLQRDALQVFYVDQFRFEGRDTPIAFSPWEVVQRMSECDGSIHHVFSTSGDAMRFASAVHQDFYSQQAEACGGEISV